MTEIDDSVATVRYIVDDVQAAIDFYTTHLGFSLRTAHLPAFADVTRGPLRLLLSGPASSGARAPHLRTPQLPAATASTSPLTISMPRSSACAAPDCPSAATSSPAPADARSCSPTPAGNLIELFTPAK